MCWSVSSPTRLINTTSRLGRSLSEWQSCSMYCLRSHMPCCDTASDKRPSSSAYGRRSSGRQWYVSPYTLKSTYTNAIQFVLFFGGLSFHMCKALICHACSINMEWTTTAKELEASGFRVGLDRIVRDFKWMVSLKSITTWHCMMHIADSRS